MTTRNTKQQFVIVFIAFIYTPFQKIQALTQKT